MMTAGAGYVGDDRWCDRCVCVCAFDSFLYHNHIFNFRIGKFRLSVFVIVSYLLFNA